MIVGGLHHKIASIHNIIAVAPGKHLGNHLYPDLGIKSLDSLFQRLRLAHAGLRCTVKELPLQVGNIDGVEIRYSQMPNTRAGELHGRH